MNVLSVISILLWICVPILLILAVILYSLNRNQEVTAKLVTGIVVGSLTFLSTVYFSLKAWQMEDSFVCWAIIHRESKKPAMLPQENDSDKLRSYMSSLAQIGSSVDLTQSLPKNDDEQFLVLAEILQCKFVEDIATLQRRGRSVRLTSTPQGAFTKGLINRPIELKDSKKIVGNTLNLNRFSKGIKIFEKNGYIPLPEGTKIYLEQTPSTPQILGKHSVFLVKPNYFKAEISIQSLASTEAGVMPDKFITMAETTDYRTFQFSVKMSAEFDRLTSGSSKSAEYRKWFEWLFAEIKKANSSDALEDSRSENSNLRIIQK